MKELQGTLFRKPSRILRKYFEGFVDGSEISGSARLSCPYERLDSLGLIVEVIVIQLFVTSF